MIYLADLLRNDRFGDAVSDLAGNFRVKHGLPKIHQVGLVVSDVEAAAAELEKSGMGPFFIAAGSPVSWLERGEQKDFQGKLGIAYHHNVELELLEAGKGSDFYRQSLDPGGEITVQHLGFLVPDVDVWAENLAASGYPVWVRGKLKSGPSTADFAYMDTVNDAGIVIEFISWKMMGIRIRIPPSIYHALGRLEKLSGKRCISL
ncbi:MAG: hypothetical protein E4H39_00795 [Syntrophobacterales bacterium]|nr:MAG: hypothetical protein E4H39_00795 [Syntrophobacterales bacterium]